ncbi:MAG: acyl-CoA dehydrogenase family protein, partial [Actinomycetota bacterium]
MSKVPTPSEEHDELSAPSFALPLFLGELHEDLLFPFTQLERSEADKVKGLIASLHDALAGYDPRAAEERGWVGDDVIAALGELGLLGLYAPEEYGGQGLSQTGYCRVMEDVGRIDGALSVVLGVHQSIGMKPIVLFGRDEQKQRLLPDLAAGRKLAGFALTEPNAGSDAFHMESRAVRQRDGSYVLNGEKRYIGNGSKDILVTFAASDQGHVALIVEKGMDGFEVGPRHDTMGLRANDLRPLRFKDVVIPADYVLGEPGDGFKIAMHTLNNGRMSLGTGAVGATKRLIDLAINHVQDRRQFGQPSPTSSSSKRRFPGWSPICLGLNPWPTPPPAWSIGEWTITRW